MKMSLCQMIAIVCVLAVSLLTVTPFVQTVEADSYTVPHYDVTIYTCENCGRGIWSSSYQAGTTTIYHHESSGHTISSTADYTVVPCGYCDYCYI